MFKTHNDLIEELTNNTSVQGSITCSFKQLADAFGTPFNGRDRKSDVELSLIHI